MDTALPLVREAGRKEHVPLSRYTTRDRRAGAVVRHAGVRRGAHLTSLPGPTPRAFRSPSWAWARTSLPPTRDSPGVVLKLVDDLARVEAVDRELVAGGEPALAVCLHRARAAELGGIEFVCAIPGTVGGGVWMNAGAYGGDIAGVLRRALVVDPGRAADAAELGLRYRSSGLRPARWWLPRSWRSSRPLGEIKEAVAAMQARRKAAQPTNKRTFGSVFKNPSRSTS